MSHDISISTGKSYMYEHRVRMVKINTRSRPLWPEQSMHFKQWPMSFIIGLNLTTTIVLLHTSQSSTYFTLISGSAGPEYS